MNSDKGAMDERYQVSKISSPQEQKPRKSLWYHLSRMWLPWGVVTYGLIKIMDADVQGAFSTATIISELAWWSAASLLLAAIQYVFYPMR